MLRHNRLLKFTFLLAKLFWLVIPDINEPADIKEAAPYGCSLDPRFRELHRKFCGPNS